MIRNVLIGIILTFVVIFLILLIVYTAGLNKASNNLAIGKSKQMPPWNYFRKYGSQCPDYWENVGETSDGKVMCKNTMNVPVFKNDNTCYSQPDERIKEFPKMDIGSGAFITNNGKKILKDIPGLEERCNFIKSCGPTAQESAAWIGFDNGSEGYTDCDKIVNTA